MLFDEFPSTLVSGSVRDFRYSRRLLLTAGGMLFLWPSARLLAAEESYALEVVEAPGSLSRIQTIVELSGELKLNPDGKQVKKVSLKGTGELIYDERLVAAADGETPRRDLRHYSKAAAGFVIGGTEIANQLTDDRRVIAFQTGNAQGILYSPLGPLTRDELELLDVQGGLSVVNRLLPTTAVKLGEKWNPSNETAALLLRFEVVTDNKLSLELKKVDSDIALLEMTGSVSGSVAGIASDAQVAAKLNFDLKQRRVTWLAMNIQENRQVGHAEPGFELTARVRTTFAPLKESSELTDDLVAKLPLEASDGASFLSHISAERAFQMVLSRSWKIMIDRHDVTIMRYIDRGEMLAQCNLSRLPDAEPEKLLSMETFQLDIQKSLAKNFSQFVEAKQLKTDRGLRALRVVVGGVASDIPIQWVYYHLTDDHGRQAAIVFTMDAKWVERFGGEDQALVGSLELLATPQPTKSQPPAAASKEAAPATSALKR